MYESLMFNTFMNHFKSIIISSIELLAKILFLSRIFARSNH